jgi:hypothetical protein
MQSISKQPQKLTMLLDPRGEVHVTCGILPTKAIRIPPEQYIRIILQCPNFLPIPYLIVYTNHSSLIADLPSQI